MKHKRFSDEQVIGVLKEEKAKADDVCRRHAISTATFYAWRKKYGGMEAAGRDLAGHLTIDGHACRLRQVVRRAERQDPKRPVRLQVSGRRAREHPIAAVNDRRVPVARAVESCARSPRDLRRSSRASGPPLLATVPVRASSLHRRAAYRD